MVLVNLEKNLKFKYVTLFPHQFDGFFLHILVFAFASIRVLRSRLSLLYMTGMQTGNILSEQYF